MRIVAGAYRGRSLVAPKGQSTRPTADKTRQALFNVLEHAPWSPGLDGLRVIDLFSGSGALGLEALSRGAAYCLFADTSAVARAAVRDNIASFSLAQKTSVRAIDAASLGARPPGGRFDLAFLDPPYGQGMSEAALGGLARNDWLALGAVVVVERGIGEPMLTSPHFVARDVRAWGAARVYFLGLCSSPTE